MGELIDLRARLERREADEDGAAARARLAACVHVAGGRAKLARLLTARLGWTVRASHVAAWETVTTPTADVLLAAEAVAGRRRTATGRIVAAAGRGLDLRAVAAACGPAVVADVVLRYAVETPRAELDPAAHPLASCVLRRDVVDLLAWPVTGRAPAALEGTEPPELADDERAAFFGHCREVIERAEARFRGPADPQPHRQALYFAQWDPSTQAWVQDLERRERRRWRPRLGWTPRWVAARSAAITQARQGNPAPLREFVARGLTDPACQDADLAYWCYWVGEINTIWATDNVMASGDDSWNGRLLLERLTAGITPEEPLLDLHAASISALLDRRPDLIQDPGAAAQIALNTERTLAGDALDPPTRRRLEDLHLTATTAGR